MSYSQNGMILKNFADKKWVRTINDFFDSNAFIALLAILTVLSNVMGAEFFVYSLVISYGIYLCLFGRDMRSVAAAIPFMYLSPSIQNNPGSNPNSIFYPENGLWLIIAYLVGFFVLLSVRIVLGIKRKLFVGTRWKLLSGFAFLAVGFLLGGVGQDGYTILNLRYGTILFLSLFLVYFCLILLVDWRTVRRDYFAWIGTFMGLIVCVELLNIYLQGNAIDAEGHILKDFIFTGWGISNNIGGVLICAIPCLFYLANEKTCAVPYLLLAVTVYIFSIFTGSRNCVLVGGLIVCLSLFFVLLREEKRKQTILTLLSLFIVFFAINLLFPEFYSNLFQRFEQKISNDSRVDIYWRGFFQFLESPFLGKGFYACDAYIWGVEKFSFIPSRWHCTVIQILASCGFLGALSYGYHRFQTIRLLTKKPSAEKIFIGLSLLALLLSSLVDCFIFNLGPGLFYSMALAFLEKSDELQDSGNSLLKKRLEKNKRGKLQKINN